jgi:NDP-sugar pyrophosphorylase family protein
MKAMVLAAGMGKRLRPLTVYWAKPALPFLGRPLIEYTFEILGRAGIREVVVNLHHGSDTIVQALRSAEEFRIHYSREDEILGTGGGLKKAEPFLSDGTFVLINGDTFVDVDLEEMVSWHREHGGEATLLLRPKPTGSSYTSIGLDAHARLHSLGEEVAEPYMFAGVWVLEPSILSRIPADRFSRLEVELIPRLLQEGTAIGFPKEIPWFDIGTPRRYLKACLQTARHGILRDLWKVDRFQAGQNADTVVVAGPGTTTEADVRFVGESVLGSQCRLGRGATVHRSVLWERVTLGEGAVVRHSILAEGVSIPAGRHIENKVVVKDRGKTSEIRTSELEKDQIVARIKR